MANKLQLNFSGGMNSQVSSLLMKDNECELCVNFHLDKVGAITKRRGYARYNTQPFAGKTINGLFQFNDTSAGFGYQLMVANNTGDTNGNIYYNNGGTWTVGKSTDTASLRSRFASFVDYVFRVNGTDVVASSANASTWGTTNAPATITPKFISVFSDRVYVARGSAANEKSRVWFSSLPDGAGGITWTTATDYFDVNPDDGDEITGLENNGNRLLIFKYDALYRWVFGAVEPDRLIGVGSTSQENIKTNFDKGITFFANPKGVYAYTGGRPKLISRKIQKFIDAVTGWQNTCAEVDDDHYYLAVGDLRFADIFGDSASTNGRTLSNCMLVYTISLDAWTIYSFGDPIKFLAILQNSSAVPGLAPFIAMGSNTGRTYQMFTGSSDDITATSPYPINGECRTKEYLLSFPNRTNLNWVDVFAEQRVATVVSYDIDRLEEWTTLGDIQYRVTNFRVPGRECNSVRLVFVDSSRNVQSIIEGFNLEHEPKEKRDENPRQIRVLKK